MVLFSFLYSHRSKLHSRYIWGSHTHASASYFGVFSRPRSFAASSSQITAAATLLALRIHIKFAFWAMLAAYCCLLEDLVQIFLFLD
jgi:hypothetical protein